MKSLNEKILANLLQERNLALAKKSIFEKASEVVPEHFTRRLEIVEAAIARHESMILEDAEKEVRK